MSNRRLGFTLIELLTVIGILVLLLGIAVVGLNQVNRSSNARATGVTLGNAEALIAEYESSGTSLHGPIYGFYGVTGAPPPGSTAPINSFLAGPIGLGSSFTITDVTPNGTDRYPVPPSTTGTGGNVVGSTQYAMALLSRMPVNKSMIGQLPPRSLMKIPYGPPKNYPQTPILQDGWANPIILVPAGGLEVNLTVNNTPTPYVIRTSGNYLPGSLPPTLKSNDRPFWASAGPDGDFSKGDDNVYSFQK